MSAGIGYFNRKDFGTIEKCPHCPAREIPKRNHQQRTCGSDHCRAQQAANAPSKRKRR
jgi:hypothetical protein